MTPPSPDTRLPPHLDVAYINDNPVPLHLTLAMQNSLFPSGSAGLRRIDTAEIIFPNENGNILLKPGVRYSLKSAQQPDYRGTNQILGETSIGSPRLRNDSVLSQPLSQGTPSRRRLRDGSYVAESHEVSQPIGRGPKLVLDRIHEHVQLHPLVCAFIDTPEFQRLRTTKQLGMTSYLYPGATHTRFEHSIGVSHLAGELCQQLHERQPELGITKKDILCVSLAGLCHDLGHGPFSHMFENVINRLLPPGSPTFHHEIISVKMVRLIADRLQSQVAAAGLTQNDINFIVLMISGLKPGKPWPSDVGRSSSKRFLVDIVANKRNGIDVDKLDYFIRDSVMCYGRASVDCQIKRLIGSCRAIEHEGEMQLCWEEKMASSLGDIFSLRARLHKYCYQHRITKTLDHMMTDAFIAAEPFFRVRGTNGVAVSLTECVSDLEGYTQLGDWIASAISASPDPELEDARSIIRRIECRDLYKSVGFASFNVPDKAPTAEKVKNACISAVDEENRDELESSLIIEIVKITYGSCDSRGIPDDPINHVCFYHPKNDLNTAHYLDKDRHSPMFTPSVFCELSVLAWVRCKEHQELAAEAFNRWKQTNQRILVNAIPNQNVQTVHTPRPKKEAGMKSASVTQNMTLFDPMNGGRHHSYGGPQTPARGDALF